MKKAIGLAGAALILGLLCLEGGLRYSGWSKTDFTEGFVRLSNHFKDSKFPPQTQLVIAGMPFETNSSGERDLEHKGPKAENEIRIGVFGGLNVLGLGLPENMTLGHFMRIHPPDTCELQGRKCQFFSYGRLSASGSEISQLIEKKMAEDSLDMIVWIADPFTNIKSPPTFRTSSHAVNWFLSIFSRASFLSSLKMQSQTQSMVTTQDLESVRELIFEKQKDFVAVIVPSLDRPIDQQRDWEREISKSFFQSGFLPMRTDNMIIEATRESLALRKTGLLSNESLRAIASVVRQRLEIAPQMRRLKP